MHNINNKIVLFLIIVEVVLFVIMAFTAGKDYRVFPKLKKIIWRIILLIPIGCIIVPNVIFDPQKYKVLLTIGLCVVLLADMAIIFSGITGLFIFLAYHIINIINYTTLPLTSNKLITLSQWIILIVMLFLWIIILKMSFKKVDFIKFLDENNVPKIIRQPILPELVLFIYIASELISGWCGFAKNFIDNSNYKLFSIFALSGAFIFTLGDYFIFFEMLKRKDRPFHQILNNTLYYVPLIIYVLLSTIKLK